MKLNLKMKISHKRILKILIDTGLIFSSYFFSFWLRFDGHIAASDITKFWNSVGFLLLLTIISLFVFKLYHGIYAYASVKDLINLVKALTVSFVIYILLLYALLNKFIIPRSVLFIYFLVSFITMGGARFSYRLIYELLPRRNQKRILVIGAGEAGEMIVHQMLNDPKVGYRPVAYVDDDPKKYGLYIHNVPVLGNCDDIEDIIKKKNIDEIFIAVPSATPQKMQRIVSICENTNIEFKTVPGLREVINGNIKLSQIRKVKIEDLLDRDTVQMDKQKMKMFIRNKTIMVTGAAGSIGSELCRQILRFNPYKLILYDRAENNLFYLDHEFQYTYSKDLFKTIIGDINDSNKTRSIIKKYHPDVIFHAAAFKHVPLMEFHPEEAVKNNVFGTMNISQLARETEVDKFVLISTDKAVKPSSVMGATKRLAEMYIQGLNGNYAKTKFITVRFGNVLASDGSVIKLFQKQIAQGGPIKVTHPEMERYFMTIEEAAQLILKASAIGTGGEVFILDMGKPIKILDLAKHLITLSGFKAGEDIKIEFMGRRPGEKLCEDLWNGEENHIKTENEKIYMASTNIKKWKNIDRDIKDLRKLVMHMDREKIIRKLKEIIPDYNPIL